MINIIHSLPSQSATLVAVTDDGYLKHELEKLGFHATSVRVNHPFYTQWQKLKCFEDKVDGKKVLLVDSVCFLSSKIMFISCLCLGNCPRSQTSKCRPADHL